MTPIEDLDRRIRTILWCVAHWVCPDTRDGQTFAVIRHEEELPGRAQADVRRGLCKQNPVCGDLVQAGATFIEDWLAIRSAEHDCYLARVARRDQMNFGIRSTLEQRNEPNHDNKY